MMTASLAEQRLTLNAGKTLFLTPDQVVIHFQLDANKDLEDWNERALHSHETTSDNMRSELEDLWHHYSTAQAANKGNWDKILKRFYASALRVDADFLEDRALEDLVRYPHLGERIFGYLARRNRGAELLDLFQTYMDTGENLFEETEFRFFESLLFLDPNRDLSQRIQVLSELFAKRTLKGQTGRPLGRASATLALFWFGASSPKLLQLFSAEDAPHLPKEVARAWLACVFANKPEAFQQAVRCSFGHSADDVLRIVRFLEQLISGQITSLGNYKNLKPNWPLRGKYYDGRAWLLLAIASHGPNEQLRSRLKTDFPSFRSRATTVPELRLAKEIGLRLNPY